MMVAMVAERSLFVSPVLRCNTEFTSIIRSGFLVLSNTYLRAMSGTQVRIPPEVHLTTAVLMQIHRDYRPYRQ
jgi:hypothetical protein